MPRNKDTLTVIVNGIATEVEANVHAPLHTIIPRALQQTGNTGQPPENWELRDPQGQLLDLNRKIGDFDFDDDTVLSLNLKAGVEVAEPQLLVDPDVSRVKFERELEQYRELEHDHRRRGWWLLDATFPEIFVVFATPQLKPPAVVFGAMLDFTNYDLWAPSVRLVDPFTCEPYRARELPTVLKRRLPAPSSPELAALGLAPIHEQSMMQWHDPDEIPFLCLPGVREYHAHPGHTGDSWLLHRGGSEGTLHFLLHQLYVYGVQPLNGYQLGLQVTGFRQQEAPT